MPDSLHSTSLSPPHSSRPYRGRFAPSPTGPLHLGSLIAALASYLDARRNNGVWLVRIDDLDPPREISGAADSILNSLQQHGLQWDEELLWQSKRGTAYEQALIQLEQQTFQCDCSRNMLGANGICQRGCQSRSSGIKTPSATRICVPENVTICFNDQIQGKQEVALGKTSSNFLVHRKDGLYAYQLAVVVDDAHQGITHIVRGSDLLDTTARQQFLQRAMGYPTPQYCHIPVITNDSGQKFSKQNHAPPLADRDAPKNLRAALQFLRQAPPPGELNCPGEILNFADHHWSPQLIPATMSIASQ
jgi:glutamyl-Q tRNA(Asp) synthetase